MRWATATASATERAVPFAGCVTPSGRERLREPERGLTAELDDDSAGPFPAHDLEHILQGQGLEVQLVGDVEIGRHRLGVRVDHDRLEAELAQRQAGPDAA